MIGVLVFNFVALYKEKYISKAKVFIHSFINFRNHIITIDSRYNELRRKTKNSSLYRELVKLKIEKNLEFLLKYPKNPV